MQGGAPDTSVNVQKVRSCWIYSPTTNNVDVSCSRPPSSGSCSVMQRLGQHAMKQSVLAAMLRPSFLNSKHSGCKFAQRIFEQVAPDVDVPTACTLEDVADVCTAQRKRGKPIGAPQYKRRNCTCGWHVRCSSCIRQPILNASVLYILLPDG